MGMHRRPFEGRNLVTNEHIIRPNTPIPYLILKSDILFRNERSIRPNTLIPYLV